MATRIEFNVGHVEFNEMETEIVGERALPCRVDVHFPGADGQPALHMVLGLVAGAPVCRALRFTAHPDGRAVRPVDLAAVKIREWTDAIYAECAMPVEVSTKGSTTTITKYVPGSGDRIDTLEAFGEARKGKGARRITPRLLKEAARIYRDNVEDRPIQAVAAALCVSERSASSYITKARAAGYLPPTTRGKRQA